MKKIVSYLLLVAYLLMLVKPVLPYITDTIAHTFYKYEHIASVHKENGKTHIHFELQQAARESASDKNIPGYKESPVVTPHIVTAFNYNFEIEAHSQKHFPHRISFHAAIAIAGNYPPPKNIV